MPLSEGEQQIANFITNGGVQGVTHVLGTDRLWGQYGANSLPSWMSISASGQTRVGAGSIPNDVIGGGWTD